MGNENLQGQETGTEFTEEGQGSEDYSLAGGFLDRVPQEHRPIVEPYVKQWDAGVTRRFQDLHGELKPYQELGSYEDLQQMAQIIEVLNNEPERVFQALQEQLYPEGLPQAQNGTGDSAEAPGLPPEFMSRFDKTEETLMKLAEYVVGMNTAQQEASEDAELDDYMQLLRDEYGDFDEKFVLTRMYNGVDGETAVQEWNSAIQERINQAMGATQNLPPVLSNGGGGAVPVETQNLSAIPRGDLKKFVADILAQSQQG